MSDPSVLALLKGLKPSVTPEPMEVASTDGELAASFSAGPREVPKAHGAVADEASVVVKPGAGKRAKKKGPPDPERIDTTFRLRPKDRSYVVPIVVAIVLVGAAVAFWYTRSAATTASTGTVPTATASSVRTTPPLRAIPSDIPPPPSVEAIQPDPVDPPRATPVATAKPAPAAPSAKPTKHDPRSEDDEPARVR